MPDNLSIIGGEYLRDLLYQPQALADTCEGLRSSKELKSIAQRLGRGKFKRVVLTGMGSSFHALHLLNLDLISHGLPSSIIETSELVHYQIPQFDPATLIVAVSQSGESAEMVRLLKMNRKRSPLVAVTNTAGSALAKCANAAVLTHAGSEFSVSCKTYVSTVVALRWLAAALCGGNINRRQRNLRRAAAGAGAYLTNWRDHVRALANALRDTRHLFLVGRGPSLAAVGTGALIVKEAAHFHAEGMSSAAFRHGPMEMADGETSVFVFSGDARTRKLNRTLLTEIRQYGGRSEWIGKDAALAACRMPDHDPDLRPILEILPVQMMTLALAAREGREAGRFDRVTKITTTE